MSNKLSLFDISRDQLDIIELIDQNEEELDEVDQAMLAINKQNFVEKAIDYISVMRHCESNVERGKQAIAQVTAYIKRNERVANSLKPRLEDAVKLFGPTEAGFYKLSLKKSEETIIDDETKLPAEYTSKKTVISPDKVKIKAAINEGKVVPGAHINKKQSLQIK